MQRPFRRGRGRGGEAHGEQRDAAPTAAPGPVTAIRELPRRAGRYTIDVGGVPVGPVSAEVIGSLGIRLGATVDEAALLALAAGVRRLACYDQAVAALARRSRASEELRRWLRQREHAAEDIDDALGRLQSLGMLDDEAFARGFVHSRAVGRGFGTRRIAAELARRGAAARIIDGVLAEHREGEDGDEGAALEAAAQRRLRALGKLEPEVARRRLLGWLVRRGFGVGEAGRVVARLMPDRQG
jgi:regulatory protein